MAPDFVVELAALGQLFIEGLGAAGRVRREGTTSGSINWHSRVCRTRWRIVIRVVAAFAPASSTSALGSPPSIVGTNLRIADALELRLVAVMPSYS